MEEAWELAAMSEAVDTHALRKLHKRSQALLTAMNSTKDSDAPDHGKWGAAIAFIHSYNGLAQGYHHYAQIKSPSPDAVKIYDPKILGGLKSAGWTSMKRLFDTAYMDALMLEAMLSDYSTPIVSELSDFENFFSLKLRRTFTKLPERELDVQDNIETLLIGRGLTKPNDYDRETGRTKSSGKEDIPDFVLKLSNTALEVKLVKSKDSKRQVVEQMRADILAYKVGYEQVLFVVYDLGFVRDVSEFVSGFAINPGVRVVVVKQ